MNWNRRIFYVLLLLILPLLSLPAHASTNFLAWHRTNDANFLVDADISTWNLRQLLPQIAAETGWHIYVDPGASRNVSVKFKGLDSGPALRSMLGDLGFALVPQTNAATRLYVFRSTVSQATTLVKPVHKAAKPIPRELVVTLKPGAKTKIEDLARSLGAKIIGRMDAQHTYLLQFADDATTLAATTQLAANPDVAGIDVNFPLESPPALAGTDTSPDLQLKPKTNDDNNCQLIVGLIDTPVQSVGTSVDNFILPQIHVAGDVAPSTQLTHGTAMAQTILDGIQNRTKTTSVKILPVDVYGNSESTTTFDVASGIVQAVNNGANIINLSLGGTGDSQTLHNTIIQVSQQGIPIYAAAGNDPVTTPTYPAAYPEVVSVTATDSSGNIASYANRGSFIDMTAPGDNVVGYGGQSYLVEGTSTSTAFVSGAAAGLADANNVCADKAESLLQKSTPKSSILKTVP